MLAFTARCGGIRQVSYRTTGAIVILPLPGQLDLPACEHEPSKLLLQRRANAPLQPSKPQKPVDIGLFSDTAKQVDLEDLL